MEDGRSARQHMCCSWGGGRPGRKGTGVGATFRKRKDEEKGVLKWKMCNR